MDFFCWFAWRFSISGHRATPEKNGKIVSLSCNQVTYVRNLTFLTNFSRNYGDFVSTKLFCLSLCKERYLFLISCRKNVSRIPLAFSDKNANQRIDNWKMQWNRITCQFPLILDKENGISLTFSDMRENVVSSWKWCYEFGDWSQTQETDQDQ